MQQNQNKPNLWKYGTIALCIIVFIFLGFFLFRATNTQDSVRSEAKQELDKLLASMVTKCGDVYSGKTEAYLIQFKNPAFNMVEANTLTEADRLNGVEWKAATRFSCSSYRIIMEYLGEGKWETCPTEFRGDIGNDLSFFKSVGIGVYIQKAKGKWQFDYGTKPEVKPSDCTNIPPKL